MKKFVFLVIWLLNVYTLFAQINSKLVLDFDLFDYKYSYNSAKTYSNSTSTLKMYDFLKAYNSPSMHQSISWSAAFYNSLNFGLSKLKINWFNNEFVNYLTETTIFVTAELLSTYIPLGDAWLHEEFHRAVLTNNFTRSYNQVNDISLFSELISVNNVTDEDLIRFKSQNPVDFVRLHSAGIEGEYMLAYKLNSYNFFYNQSLPYFAYTLMWAINSFYYVWFCHTENAEITTNEINIEDGLNIKIRDFTGLDFTAWVYDLYDPFEPYQDRGIHQSGVGIDRYIKPSDLTDEQLKYLKNQGFLQFVNFVSPMLFGINRIPIEKNQNTYYINFAFRHLLNSFGNDISFHFFYQKDKINLISTLHLYQNQRMKLPGIELELIDYDFNLNKFKIRSSFQTNVWAQPANLLFSDKTISLGGAFNMNLKFGKEKFFPYIEFLAKTKGWLAGNEFQDDNFSIRFGMSWYLF